MNATAMTAIKMPGLRSVPASADRNDVANMDTMIVTPEKLTDWLLPGLQRPLVRNKKSEEIAAAMQREAAKSKDASATISGVITLGMLEKKTYLVDGQHRLYGAFLLACRELLAHDGVLVKQAYVDVRVRHFKTMSEMSDEFIELNSQINPTKPDDILRALASASPHMQAIQQACPYIGYDLTGDKKKTTMLSMSSAIRTWFGSGGLVPAAGPRADELVRKYLDEAQTEKMIGFFTAATEAGWDHDAFRRLWSALNLGINMWLYRRTVLAETINYRSGGHAPMVLTRDQYIACMRSLMEAKYLDDLVGRSLRFQDRVPCYTRIKEHFTPVLKDFGIDAPRFPQAQWG